MVKYFFILRSVATFSEEKTMTKVRDIEVNLGFTVYGLFYFESYDHRRWL